MSALALVALGLALGMRHATDPDHVIAVSTIVARHRSIRGAALIGALWGVGHTLTILVVGGAIILFKWVIPARIGLTMELSVGLMLIVLGMLNLTGTWRRILHAHSFATPPSTMEGHSHVPRGQPSPHSAGAEDAASVERSHSHPHQHGDYIHTHAHSHDPERHGHAPDRTPLGWLDRQLGALGAYQLVRPLVVGTVHGLAGSAAVALLVLATIGSPGWSVVYLLVFGLGTVAGMMLITAAIGVPFAVSGRRFSRLNDALRVASGVVSVAFGLFLAYRIGVVDGLLTGHPHWVPE